MFRTNDPSGSLPGHDTQPDRAPLFMKQGQTDFVNGLG